MKNIEFAFIAYPATDLERSRTFYEGVLGPATVEFHDPRARFLDRI